MKISAKSTYHFACMRGFYLPLFRGNANSTYHMREFHLPLSANSTYHLEITYPQRGRRGLSWTPLTVRLPL